VVWLVDATLKTSDDNIYAARGVWLSLNTVVHGKKVRIPLAGPANRQGRMPLRTLLAKDMNIKVP